MTAAARPTPKSALPHPAGTSISRREFLYYLLGGSGALLAARTCAGVAWFSQKSVRYGLDSGVFLLDLATLLPDNLQITNFPDGRAWLVRLDNGLEAYFGECTADRVLYRWVPTNHRFECPRCGSKFRLDGTWIEGPARRDLDRFVLEVTTSDSTHTTLLDGSPVPVDGAARIVLDTTRRILGRARSLSAKRFW
jgi:cytochrome b6-f complex iron-sulfur subunit